MRDFGVFGSPSTAEFLDITVNYSDGDVGKYRINKGEEKLYQRDKAPSHTAEDLRFPNDLKILGRKKQIPKAEIDTVASPVYPFFERLMRSEPSPVVLILWDNGYYYRGIANYSKERVGPSYQADIPEFESGGESTDAHLKTLVKSTEDEHP